MVRDTVTYLLIGLCEAVTRAQLYIGDGCRMKMVGIVSAVLLS